ncbi:hypothetical protein LO763_22015 [Glycomyces sp. A-F 0318]|uniref:hypothetical protein n=1 Tax=Glycomyces amatae TaxID=2881355 RepID=UPI001E350B33|nr:hypothetical protein [Glycomyces amatae]MCD0446293.1 hypothetical protein [Glycomyces amatae]
MGVAEAIPDLRCDVVYLDGELVRMEAEPWCGQVLLYVGDGHTWHRIGVVIAADTPEATAHVVPDADAWAARGRNRARLTTSSRDYLRSLRARP